MVLVGQSRRHGRLACADAGVDRSVRVGGDAVGDGDLARRVGRGLPVRAQLGRSRERLEYIAKTRRLLFGTTAAEPVERPHPGPELRLRFEASHERPEDQVLEVQLGSASRRCSRSQARQRSQLDKIRRGDALTLAPHKLPSLGGCARQA
jgi:hypothetical protein